MCVCDIELSRHVVRESVFWCVFVDLKDCKFSESACVCASVKERQNEGIGESFCDFACIFECK